MSTKRPTSLTTPRLFVKVGEALEDRINPVSLPYKSDESVFDEEQCARRGQVKVGFQIEQCLCQQIPEVKRKACLGACEKCHVLRHRVSQYLSPIIFILTIDTKCYLSKNYMVKYL